MFDRSTLTTLVTVALLSLVAGCDALSGLNPFGGGSEEAPPPSPVTVPTGQAPAGQTPTGQAPAAAPNVPQSQRPFHDAVNQAMAAANAVQTAKTQAEWQNVVTLWQNAIALMKQVPPEHPRHDVAQQKVTEYTGYLQYAQKNAAAKAGQ